jgi:hypothetical protein
MVILVLAVVPLVGMLEAGLRAATSTGEYDTARALANERLEQVRALPYSGPGGADSAVERYAPPGPPDATEGDLNISLRTAFVDEDLSGPAGSPPTGQIAGRCSLAGTPALTRPSGSYRGSRREAPVGPGGRIYAARGARGDGRDGRRAARALRRLRRERQGLRGGPGRLGLARMERKIRAAYPRDKAGGDATLLTNFGEECLDFGNDLDGNRRTFDPATGLADSGERISYTLDAGGAPLRNGRLLVGYAGDIDGDGRALTFEYFDANGDPVVTGDGADVYLVRIELRVSADTAAGGEPVERVLRTAVALRNR